LAAGLAGGRGAGEIDGGGVNTLPTVLLLDAAGRITHRDLEGERLRTAVRRALPQK
jgi:hypothetical protein